MIPRKIHYCWFSKDPYPPLVQECIASWHENMPDWEFVLWDYEKIKEIDSVWLKECLEARKWAFAADFVRLWAVYHEGGVYLDSDVLIFRSLECFLNNRMFIGRESHKYHTFEDAVQVYLTSHCFGAEAGHSFLKLNLSYYQDRHFTECSSPDIPNVLRYDMQMLPFIQSRLAEPFGYDPVVHAPDHQHLAEGIEVYPPCFFCWIPELEDIYYNQRFARHLGLASWREPDFWESPQVPSITFSYKIRWRIVKFLSWIAEKFDYRMVRIHPDGRI